VRTQYAHARARATPGALGEHELAG
jgi:hypothetical protein